MPEEDNSCTRDVPEVRVSCYSGFRGCQTPRSFHIGGRTFRIRDVLREWIEEDLSAPGSRRRIFDVVCDDGGIFRLIHHLADEGWSVVPEPNIMKGLP